MSCYLVGEKIGLFIIKKREYKGEEVEKREIFPVLGWKNIILENSIGCGRKI